MESLPSDVILEFQPDTLNAVRKMYNLNKPGEMSDAIDIFETWIKQQKHFVKKDFDRDYLERTIISAKGSIERAKGRLDKLCTLRTLIPHFFGDYDDVRIDFKKVHDADLQYVPLPKMTSKYERVYLCRNYAKTMTTDTLLDGFRLCAMIAEYLKAHDYAASYMFVVDIREGNIADFVTKVGFMDFRNVMTLVTEGYGMRLTGIHLLTNHKILDALIMLMRQVMSEKIGNRIKVHRTLESLYEYAPKEVLPVEYGGGESRTVDELTELWLDVMNTPAFKEYRRNMNTACTDENVRQADKFNEQYMGMPGTFRTLTVD